MFRPPMIERTRPSAHVISGFGVCNLTQSRQVMPWCPVGIGGSLLRTAFASTPPGQLTVAAGPGRAPVPIRAAYCTEEGISLVRVSLAVE